MADKHFNQQYNQDQDRDQDRNQWSGENRNSDQNTGYSGSGQNRNDQWQQQRVNYIPDNQENRNYEGRNYNDGRYNQQSNYGSQQQTGSGWQNRQGGYGQYGNAYGQGNWDRHQEIGHQGQQGHEDNYARQQYHMGREDWGRGRVNTGYSNDDYDQRLGNNYNYGNSYNGDRESVRYGRGGSYNNRMDDRNDRGWWDRTKDKISSMFTDDDDRNRSRDYSGGHRGKGPSDYRRSQDRIREDVCDRLTDDDRIDASHINVQIEEDAVILSGTVSSREEKRRAEDLVESISGVRNVENRIRVGNPSGMAGREYTGNTDNTGGIGNESGTTNEIIRNTGSKRGTDSSWDEKI